MVYLFYTLDGVPKLHTYIPILHSGIYPFYTPHNKKLKKYLVE